MSEKKKTEEKTTVKSTTSPEERRSEKAGILNFTREMVSALLMAFVAIVYVIQAFKIPTGSMENSLLVGDFLLGIKFIYGAPVFPFAYTKFPGITKPKPGDIVIFKYPGSDPKDYIKRCVAGPGQTIEIKQKNVYIDGEKIALAPRGKYRNNGLLLSEIMDYEKLRIPAKGDTIYPNALPIREFLFCKHLIHQENPELSLNYRFQSTPILNRLFRYKRGEERVTMKFAVYIDDEQQNYARISTLTDNWIHLKYQLDMIKENLHNEYITLDTIRDTLSDSLVDSTVYRVSKIEIRNMVFLDGKRVNKYIVRNDNYFMMGDNRDNSLDSRFWGYLNRNFVKAKAFILYFSLAKFYENGKGEQKLFKQTTMRYPHGEIVKQSDDPKELVNVLGYLQQNRYHWHWNEKGELITGKRRNIPILFFPIKIRWNRIGKLIRGWDGLEKK